MTFSIALSGKGGVGKTNISALLIRQLCERGRVLAIDADPDSNLPQALGVTVRKSVGEVRESVMNRAAAQGIEADKGLKIFEKNLHNLVEETERFDLVVMGRPEGEGCYCAINHIIRQVIDTRAKGYDFTVIDCEAGLEHLSRRTTADLSLMIIVTDPTLYGLMAAKRIGEISRELLINFGQILMVANKITCETRDYFEKMARENGLEIDEYIPYAPEIANLDASGGSIFELPANSEAFITVEKLCRHIPMLHTS